MHAVCVYGGGNFGWIFTATGALYTCSAVDDSTGDRDWGLLFVPGGVLSSAAGLAGNVGIFWSDAQNLDDLTGWAGDIGGALGFGKTLGVALDCYPSTNSQGRHITSWALGVTGGPNFSALGLVEVHGGAGYGILTPLRLRLAKDQPLSGDGVTTTGNHTPPNLGSSGGGGIPFGERHDPSDPMSSEHYRK